MSPTETTGRVAASPPAAEHAASLPDPVSGRRGAADRREATIPLRAVPRRAFAARPERHRG